MINSGAKICTFGSKPNIQTDLLGLSEAANVPRKPMAAEGQGKVPLTMEDSSQGTSSKSTKTKRKRLTRLTKESLTWVKSDTSPPEKKWRAVASRTKGQLGKSAMPPAREQNVSPWHCESVDFDMKCQTEGRRLLKILPNKMGVLSKSCANVLADGKKCCPKSAKPNIQTRHVKTLGLSKAAKNKAVPAGEKSPKIKHGDLKRTHVASLQQNGPAISRDKKVSSRPRSSSAVSGARSTTKFKAGEGLVLTLYRVPLKELKKQKNGKSRIPIRIEGFDQPLQLTGDQNLSVIQSSGKSENASNLPGCKITVTCSPDSSSKKNEKSATIAPPKEHLDATKIDDTDISTPDRGLVDCSGQPKSWQTECEKTYPQTSTPTMSQQKVCTPDPSQHDAMANDAAKSPVKKCKSRERPSSLEENSPSSLTWSSNSDSTYSSSSSFMGSIMNDILIHYEHPCGVNANRPLPTPMEKWKQTCVTRTVNEKTEKYKAANVPEAYNKLEVSKDSRENGPSVKAHVSPSSTVVSILSKPWHMDMEIFYSPMPENIRSDKDGVKCDTRKPSSKAKTRMGTNMDARREPLEHYLDSPMVMRGFSDTHINVVSRNDLLSLARALSKSDSPKIEKTVARQAVHHAMKQTLHKGTNTEKSPVEIKKEPKSIQRTPPRTLAMPSATTPWRRVQNKNKSEPLRRKIQRPAKSPPAKFSEIVFQGSVKPPAGPRLVERPTLGCSPSEPQPTRHSSRQTKGGSLLPGQPRDSSPAWQSPVPVRKSSLSSVHIATPPKRLSRRFSAGPPLSRNQPKAIQDENPHWKKSPSLKRDPSLPLAPRHEQSFNRLPPSISCSERSNELRNQMILPRASLDLGLAKPNLNAHTTKSFIALHEASAPTAQATIFLKNNLLMDAISKPGVDKTTSESQSHSKEHSMRSHVESGHAMVPLALPGSFGQDILHFDAPDFCLHQSKLCLEPEDSDDSSTGTFFSCEMSEESFSCFPYQG